MYVYRRAVFPAIRWRSSEREKKLSNRLAASTVHSLISGPQTFSDFFSMMKFVEKLFCAINVLYVYFLKMCLI